MTARTVAATLAVLLLGLAVLAVFRLMAMPALLLAVALGLAVAHLYGYVGRWALWVAGAALVLALPAVALGTLRALGIFLLRLVRLLPVIVAGLAVYILVKALNR